MTFLYTHFQSLLLLINLSFCCTFVIPQKYVISELKFNVPEQQHEETPEFVARNKLVTIVIKMQKNSNSKWATHAAEQKKRMKKVSQKNSSNKPATNMKFQFKILLKKKQQVNKKIFTCSEFYVSSICNSVADHWINLSHTMSAISAMYNICKCITLG